MPRDSSDSLQHHARLQIEGLSCASCVRRAETAVQGVAGVASASVNLATGKADVDFANPADLSAIKLALANAGYPAIDDEISFDVQGATCATCVGKIEKALQAVPGVSAATMNLATERATVTVLRDAVQRDDLVQAVEAAGYQVAVEATVDQPAPVDRHEEQAETHRRAMLIAAALTLPVFALEMGAHLFPAVHALIGQTIGHQASRVIQFALTTAILIFPGRVFYKKGVPALLRRGPDMNSLVALGASAAWAYSVVATFIPQALPEGSRDVYYESVRSHRRTLRRTLRR